jgi:hypothetical protein
MDHFVELIEASVADGGIKDSPRVVEGIVADGNILAVHESGDMELQREKNGDSTAYGPYQEI